MVSWKLFAVTYYLANFEYVASVGNGCPTSAYSKIQQSIVWSELVVWISLIELIGINIWIEAFLMKSACVFLL
jgi:hypothetical protein